MASIVKNRDLNYDFLRFVGVSCVILAHVNASQLIFQLRNFDVPLMVMLGGMSFVNFSSIHYRAYGEYLVGRFLRLILPTWIFLVIFYVLYFLASKSLPRDLNVVRLLLLVEAPGVGVWVVRVFFLMAIIAPCLHWVNKGINRYSVFLLSMVGMWCVYEVIFYIFKLFPLPFLGKALDMLFFQYLAYGWIFLLGMQVLKMPRRKLLLTFTICLAIFLAIALYFVAVGDGFTATQNFKNPPRLYYVSYACSVSLLLIYLCWYTSVFEAIKKNAVLGFIGGFTLWIYLWHWFFLKVAEIILARSNYIVRYLFVYAGAVLISYAQMKLVHWVGVRFARDDKKIALLRTVFLG